MICLTDLEHQLTLELNYPTTNYVGIKVSLPSLSTECSNPKYVIAYSVNTPGYRFSKKYRGAETQIEVPDSTQPYHVLYGFRHLQRASMELTQRCGDGQQFKYVGSIETGTGSEYIINGICMLIRNLQSMKLLKLIITYVRFLCNNSQSKVHRCIQCGFLIFLTTPEPPPIVHVHADRRNWSALVTVYLDRDLISQPFKINLTFCPPKGHGVCFSSENRISDNPTYTAIHVRLVQDLNHIPIR